jgi:hypothetical protein
VETCQIREVVKTSSSVNKFQHSSSSIRTSLDYLFLLPRSQVGDFVGTKPALQAFSPLNEVSRGDEGPVFLVTKSPMHIVGISRTW